MEKMENTTRDKIIWLLTVLMFSSFFILEVISWGKYVLLIATVLIALLNPYGVKIRIDKFQRYLLMFSLFCFASAIWAWLPAKAIESGVTIIEILICFSLVYGYYIERENVEALISAIKWSAIIVSAYTIIYYGGFAAISMASKSSELRLDNSFSGVNEIGMLASIGCVLQINDFSVTKRFKPQYLFVILEICIVAAAQSRQAFVILITGVLLITIFSNSKPGHVFPSIVKIFATLFALTVIFYILARNGVFTGIFERFGEGNGTVSSFLFNSESLRSLYKKLGWEHFTQNPILGIGIGSSEEMIRQFFGRRTYTHDNYIELLSCGGLVGFFIYYSLYIFIFKNLLKYKNLDRDQARICIILLIMLLMSDYGIVTYFLKERYFYLMLFSIEVANLQKKANQIE